MRLMILCVVLLLGLMGAEFIIPIGIGLPRDQFLLGFAGHGEVDGAKINSLGFTGDSPRGKKPPGKVRILTLGGSTLFNRNITARLKSRLSSKYPDLEVLGAALRQHTTRASLHKYNHLSDLQFDFVIIYHGINDLWANHVDPKDFRDDYSHLLPVLGGPWYRRSPLLDNSVICRILYNKAIYQTIPQEDGRAGFASERTYWTNLNTIIDRIEEHGGTPVLMTYAWCIPANYSYEGFLKRTVGYNNADGGNVRPTELWGPPAFVAEGMRRHNKIVRQIASSRGLLLIDQEAHMGKDLRFFSDVCHFSDEGVDHFIDHIAEKLPTSP